MSEALPFALLALFIVLLAAMPWRRPHPNHQFMLELLRLLEEDEQTNSRDSSLIHRQQNTSGQLPSIPSSESNDSAGRARS
jgi:hypothetical protein